MDVTSSLLDEIDEAALGDGMYEREGVMPEELVGVEEAGGVLRVHEGKTSKDISLAAVNTLSLGLHYPGWLKEQFESTVPDFWTQFYEDDNEIANPQTNEALQDELNGKVFSRDLLTFWAEVVCAVEKPPSIDDEHYRRYYEQLYRRIVIANPRALDVGIVPRSGDVLVWAVPKRVYTEKETHADSAADW